MPSYTHTNSSVANMTSFDQVDNLRTPTLSHYPHKAETWGTRTNNVKGSSSNTAKYISSIKSEFRGAASPALLENKLFIAWKEQVQNTIESWPDNSVATIITTSERYLLALKSSTNYRIFISSLLNAFCFNSDINQQNAVKIGRILSALGANPLQQNDVLKFMRQLRALGYSPSAARH